MPQKKKTLHFFQIVYCMSKKACPFLYTVALSKLDKVLSVGFQCEEKMQFAPSKKNLIVKSYSYEIVWLHFFLNYSIINVLVSFSATKRYTIFVTLPHLSPKSGIFWIYFPIFLYFPCFLFVPCFTSIFPNSPLISLFPYIYSIPLSSFTILPVYPLFFQFSPYFPCFPSFYLNFPWGICP